MPAGEDIAPLCRTVIRLATAADARALCGTLTAARATVALDPSRDAAAVEALAFAGAIRAA
jgi:hypothetical protein